MTSCSDQVISSIGILIEPIDEVWRVYWVYWKVDEGSCFQCETAKLKPNTRGGFCHYAAKNSELTLLRLELDDAYNGPCDSSHLCLRFFPKQSHVGPELVLGEMNGRVVFRFAASPYPRAPKCCQFPQCPSPVPPGPPVLLNIHYIFHLFSFNIILIYIFSTLYTVLVVAVVRGESFACDTMTYEFWSSGWYLLLLCSKTFLLSTVSEWFHIFANRLDIKSTCVTLQLEASMHGASLWQEMIQNK